MYNVGSLFRTSDGAGIKKIFSSGYTAVPPREQITKTALGAEKSVAWKKVDNLGELIIELKSQGVQVIALEKTKLVLITENLILSFPWQSFLAMKLLALVMRF